MLAYKYKADGLFECEVNCQRDPLESEKAGYDKFLVPGSATLTCPPEEKEGFDRKYDVEKDAWEYVEKKEPVEEAYEPTELDKAREELWKAKADLAATDYQALKMIDGEYTKEEYKPIKAERCALREKVREAEAKVAALEAEEKVDEPETK